MTHVDLLTHLLYTLGVRDSLLFVLGFKPLQLDNSEHHARRWSLSFTKQLILLAFALRRKEWLATREAILGLLGDKRRQGYVDLGIKPAQSVRSHTENLYRLFEVVAVMKGWNTPHYQHRLRTGRLTAFVHDFCEARGTEESIVKVETLPHLIAERIAQQKATIRPLTPREDMLRLMGEFEVERKRLLFILASMETSSLLTKAIMWCFERYYRQDTPESALVGQVHHLETVLTAVAYERRHTFFRELGGAEPFFILREEVVTDPHVRELFDRARRREEIELPFSLRIS